MSLLVVRHAKAGSRHDWRGPDVERSLSAKGRRQAKGLVSVLGRVEIDKVVSSPSLRCSQTVAPLAGELDLGVDIDSRLAEGASEDEVLGLARELAPVTAVVCTHGDVIPLLLDALAARDGLRLPPDYPCAKSSTWVLDAEGGRFCAARYLPPPST